MGDQKTIAVIGGGMSGLICAIHLLLKSSGGGPRVFLIEQGTAFGVGAAYSTHNVDHLLNTRAANMSPFPDRPGHFLEWLRMRPEITAASGASFVSRRLYGDYLQSLLRDAACGPDAAGRFYLVPDEAVRLEREGGGFKLHLRVGKVLPVDAVVLATGNPPPHRPNIRAEAFFDSARYIDDPWDPAAFDAVEPGDAILMLGTGLTMIDVVLTLKARGHAGPLTALSRRGLLPRRHVLQSQAAQLATPALPPHLSGALASVRRAIREAAGKGAGWQDVMDTLRPVTSAYWRDLPLSAKRRFLRHLRPWWGAHRHRLAPQVADRLEALIRDRSLAVRRGRLIEINLDERSGGPPVSAAWETPRGKRLHGMKVHHVVNCTGPGGDPTLSRSELLRGLIASGLARPDHLRLGLDVDAGGRLIARDGAVADTLFALGPPTRGMFWESTAVPDIRDYAEAVAASALQTLGRDAIPA
ncbi:MULTISPECIES: FAD/NAD(P)-binding protein [Rhodomicrobium]|uniref:FAD/NAD(P)-binding protein n=1 Tax=Rhodomicrobium TaxID=1068 RepID=UPI000B4B4282|nr:MULTISPECIES: FAD/NAD(P)-binding protein [Rhodomicrobium]